MIRRVVLSTLAALLLLSGLAAAQGSYPAKAGREPPPDFDIHGRGGTLIHVTYQKLLAPGAPDRADVCLAVSTRLTPGKTFVVNESPLYTYDGSNPGPICQSVLTHFDYDSYDMARNRRLNQGTRSDSYGKRVINPKAWAVQMAFFKDAALTKRVEVVSTDQLTDVYSADPNAREIFVPVAPGWRMTLFWLQD